MLMLSTSTESISSVYPVPDVLALLTGESTHNDRSPEAMRDGATHGVDCRHLKAENIGISYVYPFTVEFNRLMWLDQ